MLPAAHRHVKQFFGYGRYDTTRFCETIASKAATTNIPPPRNALIGSNFDKANRILNDAIKAITGLGGERHAREVRKKLESRNIHSQVETTMFS